jgi:hypothetical protein
VPTCLRVALRRRDLPRLRAAGALGALLADQGERHAADNGRTDLPTVYEALPDDLLNFQYDALACAVAAGWPGVEISDLGVAVSFEGRFLRMDVDERGSLMRVATDVDAEGFSEVWLEAVERASAP